jgi:hypothetical protein
VDSPITDVLRAADGLRCPACSAAVSAGAPWCTLCYHDLRPTPQGAVAASAVEAGVLADRVDAAALRLDPPAFDPLTAPAEALGLPSPREAAPVGAAAAPASVWPCAACGTANSYAVSACGACGTGFLAGLRESEGPLLELPVVGDLNALSRGQRLGLAAVVVFAVIALTALVTVLFG